MENVRKFNDERGSLLFMYQPSSPQPVGQIFVSTSNKHVLRGLHCSPYAKYVTCLTGRVIDMVINLDTGDVQRYELQGGDAKRVFVPPGHAHGFYALEDNTTLLYVTTGSYSADTDKTYSAKHLDWGVDVSEAIMSEADKRAPAYKPTFMVLGASGFLGSWAVHYLKKQGYGVVESSVRMEDRCALQEELGRVNPKYVICAAGVAGKPNISWCESHPMDTLRANVVGVLNVVDVCKSLNKHVTLFGSGGIFEYDEAHPEGSGKTFTELDVGNAQQPGMYMRARMLLEELLKEVSGDALYLRILYPVSSDLNPQGLIGKLLGFKSVHAVPTSVTVIDDLFPLLPILSEKRVTGILNFVNSGCIKYPDVLEACKTVPNVVNSLGKARAAAHLSTDALAAATGRVTPYAHTSVMNICKRL
jgi:dTDP-4-dehydrorhamnose 3,5-epimerase-like enzyme